MLLAMKETHSTHTDTDAWKPLRTVTAPVLRSLLVVTVAPTAIGASEPREEKEKERFNDTEGGRADQRETGEHREYVDRRLRDLAAFERRFSGIIPRRKL
jgi:hypothetical protein